MPVGWFETPDEDPVVFEDETTLAPSTVKSEETDVKVTGIPGNALWFLTSKDKCQNVVLLEEELSPTTTLPQIVTTTLLENVVTITAGQVVSTTLTQEEPSTTVPQLNVDETTTHSDVVEVVTPQDLVVVTGVSVSLDATTDQANQDTTLRPFDEKSRKPLSRLFKPKTRIPVVPASSTRYQGFCFNNDDLTF